MFEKWKILDSKFVKRFFDKENIFFKLSYFSGFFYNIEFISKKFKNIKLVGRRYFDKEGKKEYTKFCVFEYKFIRIEVDCFKIFIGKWSFQKGQIFTGNRFIFLKGKFVGLEPEWIKIKRWIYEKICNYFFNQSIKQSFKRGTNYLIGGTKGYEKYCKYKRYLNYWLFERS